MLRVYAKYQIKWGACSLSQARKKGGREVCLWGTEFQLALQDEEAVETDGGDGWTQGECI